MSLAAIILLLALVVLLAGGVWVGAALGLAGIIGVVVESGTQGLPGVAYAAWNGVNDPVLTAIPLFMLMGQVITRGGLSVEFYRGLHRLLRHVPGGLLQTNVIASGIFAAISGNSVATAATISEIAVPELRRRGYKDSYSLGSLAGGGTLGILIPPSIPLIMYASLVSVSVVDLFTAALIPGLLMLVAFSVFIAISSRFSRPTQTQEKQADEEFSLSVGKAIVGVLPILLLILVVLGGIYSGIVTVTEASALGAVGALLISAFRRGLTFKIGLDILARTAQVTAMIILIMIGAKILSYGLSVTGATRELTAVFSGMAGSAIAFLLITYLLLLVLGLFMEGISMMMLTLPILFPLLQLFDIDLVWFAIVMVILVEIGLITPPVGMNLFVIQGIAKVRLGVIFRGAIPYGVIMLLMVALLTIFPEIATWLPAVLK